MNEKVPLKETKTGHLVVSICKPFEQSKSESHAILLSSFDNDTEQNKKIIKLHRQFAHPPAHRLKSLLSNSGVQHKELFKLVDNISEACETCQKLQPCPNRPVVGFPLASMFNETVALDLKVFKNGIYLLHMIDHATRYSSGCLIRNKRKETIVEGILCYWVKWFGCPGKFLSDNGGEFINDELVDLAEKCNITIKTTGAESPWSNGLCERHNALISRNIHKVRLDVGCSMEVALAWSISAKNCLANVYGFSPNQLVFGKNPQFPNVLDNNPPANSSVHVSQILEKQHHALSSAREEFMKAEACEKIKRALARKTRLYSDKVYCSGDRVYFKRMASDMWHGPATVLGKDGQMCLLKHGGFYLRVHPCRMSPVHDSESIPVNPVSNSATSTNIDETVDPVDTGQPTDSDSDAEVLDGNVNHAEHESEESPAQRAAEEDASTVINGPAVNHKDLPKLKDVISYKTSDSNEWKLGSVVRRGGKVGERHWHFLIKSIENSDDTSFISFRDDVKEWKKVDIDQTPIENESSDRNEISEFVYVGKHASSDKFVDAKNEEIQKWKQMNVFEEVDNARSDGLLMSTRWVCTEKIKGL